ncbi:MAG: hypothetical protein M3409_05390 [Gemmatimonadota bacterium]|nr:hypothetical protein [Gemmatimonadota bacterium]
MKPASLLVNGRLKLAALAFALLLWVGVSAEQPASQWLAVPVEVALRDPGYVLAGGPVPAEVQVRFSGPGRDLWELALNRPALVLPVRGSGAEGGIFLLDPQMVQMPRGGAVAAQDVRPSSVRLILERLATREVPVGVRTSRRTDERLAWIDPPTVRPARVRLTGREERLQEVDTVYTASVQLGAPDPAFDQQIALDTTGLAGLELSARRVRVTGEVDRFAVRTLRGLVVTPPPGATISVSEAEIILEGAEGRVSAVSPGQLRVVPVRDSVPAALPAAGVSVPLRVEGLPAGVRGRPVPLRARVVPLPPPPPPPAPPDTPSVVLPGNDTVAPPSLRPRNPR